MLPSMESRSAKNEEAGLLEELESTAETGPVGSEAPLTKSNGSFPVRGLVSALLCIAGTVLAVTLCFGGATSPSSARIQNTYSITGRELLESHRFARHIATLTYGAGMPEGFDLGEVADSLCDTLRTEIADHPHRVALENIKLNLNQTGNLYGAIAFTMSPLAKDISRKMILGIVNALNESSLSTPSQRKTHFIEHTVKPNLELLQDTRALYYNLLKGDDSMDKIEFKPENMKILRVFNPRSDEAHGSAVHMRRLDGGLSFSVNDMVENALAMVSQLTGIDLTSMIDISSLNIGSLDTMISALMDGPMLSTMAECFADVTSGGLASATSCGEKLFTTFISTMQQEGNDDN